MGKKAANKSASRNGTGRRKYGEAASRKVEKAMHEMKRGELRSGGSGKRVTSRKQAIAIGLSQARERGARVPAPKRRSRS
jgi:hypothetical protein